MSTRRVALLALASLAALVALLVVGVHAPPVRTYILRQVEARLLTQTGISLRASSLDFNLFAGSVELRDLVLARAGGAAPPFLRASRVRADIAVWDLITGSVTIEEARLEGLDLHFAPGNLPDSGDGGGEPAAELPAVVISRLDAGGSLVFEDQALRVRIPSWQLAVQGQATNFEHRVALQTGEGASLAYEEREIALRPADIEASFNRGGVRLARFQAGAEGMEIEASGVAEGIADPKLDLRVKTVAELGPVLRLAGVEPALDGRLEAAVHITGASSAPQITLESATLASPEADLRLTAEFRGTEQEAQNRASLEIERLHVGRLARRLGVADTISSLVAGTVEAQWPGMDVAAAQAELKLRVSAIGTASPPQRIPVSGSIQARLRERRLTLQARNVGALGVTARADFTVALNGEGAFSGTLTARAEDLAAAADLGIEGSAELEARVFGTLERPQAALAVSGTGLGYGPVRGAGFTAAIDLDQDRVTVSEILLEWQKARITASGSLGLEGAQELAFQAATKDVPIADVLAALGREEPVSGTLSFEAQAEGTLAEPLVQMRAAVASLAAYGEPLGDLAADAGYSGGRLQLGALRLEGTGLLTAEGWFDTGTSDYQARLEVAGFSPQQLPVQGVFGMSLAAEGNLENPAARLTLRATGVSAQDRDLGGFALQATLEDHSARLSLEAPQLSVRAEAQAGTRAPYPATVRLWADDVDLSLADPGLKGRLTAALEASGDGENWTQAAASLEVSSLRIETPAGDIANEGPIRAAYTGETVEISSARLVGPGSWLSLSGKFPGTLDYRSELELSALEDLRADGRLELSGKVEGNFEKVAPSALVILRGGRVQPPGLASPVEDIEIEIALEKGSADVRRMQAALAAGSLTAQGSIPLALFPLPEMIDTGGRTGPARFQLALQGLQLGALAQLPEQFGGEISLHVEAEADKPELDAVKATLTFDRLDLKLANLLLAPQTPPAVVLSGGVAEIGRFELHGPETVIRLNGSVALADQQLRDVRLSGQLDAALLGAFASDVQASGPVRFEMAAEGALADPALSGFLELSDGQFGVTSPRIQANGIEMRVAAEGDRIRVERFEGELNGGTISIGGSARLGEGGLEEPQLNITADDIYLDFPQGVRTLSRAELELRQDGEFLVLGGSVRVQEGSYTELLDAAQILTMAGDRGGVELVEDRSPLLSRIRFDITVRTDEPLVLDNNLGELALTADLRLLGGFYRPGLAGRVEIAEGGRLFLQENEYLVEQGSVSFVNEARIEPALDLTATTSVAGRNITMRISGGGDDLELELTSDDPGDTRADIFALLLTGRTAEDLQGREANLAGEQAALSLVAGSMTGRLTRGVENTLGLSRVRLEPNLIAAESDPSARLTVGQDITNSLELIYSMKLTDSGSQIWVLDYDLTRRFSTRGTRKDDDTYRFDFQHDLVFGVPRAAGPATQARIERRVRAVAFTGSPGLPEQWLAEKFKIRRGDRYDFFEVRRGLDRLESLYWEESYLEARVRLERTIEVAAVDLGVRVESGPQLEFVWEGWTPSGNLRELVRQQWRRGVFDSQRTASCAVEIRNALAREGYLQAEVESEVLLPEPGRKRVLLSIRPGTRYRGAELVFEGASGIRPSELKSQVEKARLDERIVVEPTAVRGFLTQYYRQSGFLDAEVTAPRFELEEATGTGRIVVAIEEGPRYSFGALTLKGARALTAEELAGAAAIRPGTPYTPLAAQESRDRMEEAYWRKGYREVVIDYSLVRREEEALVDVVAGITENRQSVVGEVRVEGTRRTSESFVRGQLELDNGSLLDYVQTARSRRNLYNTGAYSAVELLPEPIAGSPAEGPRPVRLVARVQERAPFIFRYGGSYDTDKGPGFIADFTNRNSLGGGRVVGLRTQYNSDIRELRGFFGQPLLRSLPLRSDLTGFLRREIRESFITDRAGVSIQQELRMRDSFVLTYGYRFERAHTFDTDPDAFIPFDEVLRVAPLTTTLTRDTRDEILDATRGSFLSHAFELGSGKLGSTLLFARYFGQYFRYVGLSRPAPVPFGGLLERPRWIYAGGVRVGLARGLGGQELIRSERFFTGGGTTIRGFEQDGIGPRDFLERPAGGDAVLIVNNELRFPLLSIFEGVGFADFGNVYQKMSDFSLWDVRGSAGAGLRVRTPYFLLRLDYGLKLDRKPGETRGELFFSIGQAF